MALRLLKGVNPWVVPGLMRRYMPETVPSAIVKIDNLIKIVCEETGVAPEMIKKVSRKRAIVDTRKILCYVLWFHGNYNYSLKEIGALVRSDKPFDHTTVMHLRDSAKYLMETDPDFEKVVKNVYEKLKD